MIYAIIYLMAEKEDVYKKLDPQTRNIIDRLRSILKEQKCCSVEVLIDESASKEEEEMAILEGLLKEGYTIEEAEKEVAKWLYFLK